MRSNTNVGIVTRISGKSVLRIAVSLGLVFWTLFAVGSVPTAEAHTHRTPIVFDSDGALDDFRALALLLQSDQFDLRAVIASDGACSPKQGAINFRKVLRFLAQAHVPVYIGYSVAAAPPPWRMLSDSLGWARLPSSDSDQTLSAAPLDFRSIFGDSSVAITYICTGPMTNLSRLLVEEPKLRSQVRIVYFEGNSPDADHLSWNTARDTSAARRVFSSDLPIRAFDFADDDLFAFDSALYVSTCRGRSRVAELLCLLHADPRVQDMLNADHFRAWDESVVLALLDSTLLPTDARESQFRVQSISHWNSSRGRRLYSELISKTSQTNLLLDEPVIFDNFPSTEDLFSADLRPFVSQIIERHGHDEWRASILTNELHGHLGIYSLIGVKMGIRARELLGARLDELRVVSYAGFSPPLSCMNDGLQTATGASLGHGTIQVKTIGSMAEAQFSLGNSSVRLRLKQTVLDRIRRDISNAITKFGNLTPAYFSEVRRIAIKYWLELDRKEIFDET
jgi:pyrimidine-specific ribonucleoside hydrolase